MYAVAMREGPVVYSGQVQVTDVADLDFLIKTWQVETGKADREFYATTRSGTDHYYVNTDGTMFGIRRREGTEAAMYVTAEELEATPIGAAIRERRLFTSYV